MSTIDDMYSMSPWYYKGQIVTSETLQHYFGFVYMITNKKTGQKYIGRKYCWSYRKVKGKTRRQKLESDWKTYFSSSEVLKQQVKEQGPQDFHREILYLCSGKGITNWLETKLLFEHKVLESDEYLNDNILGKYFKGRTKDYLKEIEGSR